MGQDKKQEVREGARAHTAFDRDVSVRLSVVIDLYDLKVEAARAAKTTGEMLTRYTKGAHKLPFRVAAALAHGKGVSLDWLATGDGPMLLSQRTTTAPVSEGGRPDPLDEVLLANVIDGLELFTAAEDLELEPGEKGRLVVLLHRMLARRRREAGHQGRRIPPELVTPNHPVPIADDIDLADIVRIAGRRSMG